jgi:hypothetical protein
MSSQYPVPSMSVGIFRDGRDTARKIPSGKSRCFGLETEPYKTVNYNVQYGIQIRTRFPVKYLPWCSNRSPKNVNCFRRCNCRPAHTKKKIKTRKQTQQIMSNNNNNPNKPSSNDPIPPPSRPNVTATTTNSNNNGNHTITPPPPLSMEEPHPQPLLSTMTTTPHHTVPSLLATDPQQSMMLSHHQAVFPSSFSDNVSINTPPSTATTGLSLLPDRVTLNSALRCQSRRDDHRSLLQQHHHHDFAFCFGPPQQRRCRSLPEILDEVLDMSEATMAYLSATTIHTNHNDDTTCTNRHAWNDDDPMLTVHPPLPSPQMLLRRSGPRQRPRSHTSISHTRRNRRNQRGDNNNSGNGNHNSSQQ